jgi:phosphoglycerate dehydrogenase-like enzyme
MPVLVVENSGHFKAADLRAAFPGLDVRDPGTAEAAMSVCGDCEALIALAHEIPDALVAAMPKLRWVASLSTGVDHLWTLKSLPSDVLVTNGRGIHGPQMAELAFMYMIGLSRDFNLARENQKRHVWRRRLQPTLVNKTVVIVGVGLIGEEIAARCKAFGMRVVGVSDARASARGFDALTPRRELRQAAAAADFLIALTPLDATTRHLIDADVLAAMKPSAFLINIARGAVVDEAALIAALRGKRIAGAGLDVFEVEPLPDASPLWDMPNVMITPRIGGMSDIYADQVFPLVERNMRAWLAGRIDEMVNIARRGA